MRAGLIAMLVVGASISGCATLGYRLTKHADTYQYDRDVAVEVHSDPEGAQVFADGKPIGTAPFTYHAHHRVERTRYTRSGKGIRGGCVLDVVLWAASLTAG